MSSILRRLRPLLVSSIDIWFSVLFFGFYSPRTIHFDLTHLLDVLFLRGGYSFQRSPLDFAILSLLRLLLAIVLVFLPATSRQSASRRLLVSLALSLFSISYSLVKLLALSEYPDNLLQWGLWFSLAWSLTLPIGFLLAVYTSVDAAPHYSRLFEDGREEENVGETREETREEPDQTGRTKTLVQVGRLLSYCRLQWRWFASGFVFLLIYSGARIFIPYYTGQVIANIVTESGYEKLVHSVIIMSALSLVSTVFGGLRGGCFTYATSLVGRQMQLDLFSALVRQEIAFFDANTSGELMSRLTADCATMSSTVSTNVNVVLRNTVMLFGALVFMIKLSWRLTLVTFIAVPLIVFITRLYGAYYDRLSERTQATMAKANKHAEEVLSSMRTVRSFASERLEVDRYRSMLDGTLSANKRKAVAYTGYTWNNEFCDATILVAVLFYGGHLVLNKMLSTEELLSFLLYQMQLGENLYSIGTVFTGLMESVGASRKVFEYMHRTPTISNDNGTETVEVQGAVRFDNVDFSYPTRPNSQVLKNVSLALEPGQTVALVGPSGSGKSSIVALLQHFYEPAAGNVTLDDVNISSYDHHYLHEKMALVGQEPVLYSGSVRDNILYGCPWATEHDMLEASAAACVHPFVSQLEKGYDTDCGEKGVQMSGGQKQRIAIARALVRRPRLLVLDEATSALDAASEAAVQQALMSPGRACSLLVVAHRLSTVEKADRIVVLQSGRVVQQGKHAELLADRDGVYYALVRSQLLGAQSEN